MSSWRVKLLMILGVMLIACSAILALSAGHAGKAIRSRAPGSVVVSASRMSFVDGSATEFAFLSEQRSNRCSLRKAELEAMPGSMRLQGSCCFPMNYAAYRWQIRGLRQYRTVPQVPRDPYDVPVALAKRLLGYERAIHLSPAQMRTYRRAMRMSDTKGPCCCHCWRWDAFRGLSDYMIANRGYSPVRLARLIDLVEGCGGPKGS